MRIVALALLLAASPAQAGLDVNPPLPDLAPYARRSEVPALAPVQSVNTNTGAVLVPTVQRQTCGPFDITPGTATCTFATPFANTPTCWATVGPANSTYVFAQPTISATLTSATISEQAALKALSLPLGLTTLWVNPPSGTTVTLSCVGALP